MNDFLLNMALNHFEFDNSQRQRIAASIPKWSYAANLLKQHKSLINELIDVADMIAAQVAKKEAQ